MDLCIGNPGANLFEGGHEMTPYREILRLHSQGISQRSIAASCSCSRNTVARTILEAERHSLSVPLPKELTDEMLSKLFYPKETQPDPSRRMPDYEHIHRELANAYSAERVRLDR